MHPGALDYFNYVLAERAIDVDVGDHVEEGYDLGGRHHRAQALYWMPFP